MSEHVKTSLSDVKSDGQDGTRGEGSAVASAESKTKASWSVELDDLFAGKKTKKRQQEAEVTAKKQKSSSKKHKRGDETSKHDSHSGRKGGEDWVDDGLGGVYNKEGYTGRVEDGVRVFKAHLLRKPKSGQTPLCPFDCDCCFI
jgi:hypothetical protein